MYDVDRDVIVSNSSKRGNSESLVAAGFIHKWQNSFVVVWLLGTKRGFTTRPLLSKLEFMQWKDVDCPTFTQICKSAINWLEYGNSFSGIQTGCLWQTVCILERQLLASIMQNQHSSYSMSSSRNSDEKLSLRVWLFHDNAPAHKSLVAQQALYNWVCSTKPSCPYSLDLIGSQ